MTTRDEYRFTVEDETRISAAIRGTLRTWGDPATIGAESVDALERIGAHAIGCSVHDLRDSERQWVVNEIGEIHLHIG